jgi:DNA-binding response OmpR family regulator
LKKQEHEVVAVDDGLRASEAFHNNLFPMLILDWLMPVMDGLDLCRQVRKLQREHYT